MTEIAAQLNLIVERHPVLTTITIAVLAIFVTVQLWSAGYTLGRDVAFKHNRHAESSSR